MIRLNIVIVLFLSTFCLAGNKLSCLFHRNSEIINYHHILYISGFQNDCFFNSVRHFGIAISREILLQRLETQQNNPRWQNAVFLMAQQELFESQLQEPVSNLYEWFVERIRRNIPIPFRGYDENAPEDIIDLLGEEFNFDIRIVQQTPSSGLRIIRNFRGSPSRDIQRITLLYTSGEIGHFDLVIDDQTLESTPNLENLYSLSPTFSESGSQGTLYQATNQTGSPGTLSIKIIRTQTALSKRLCRQEVDSIAACKHPLILRYKESISLFDQTETALITEWINGEDLQSYLINKSLPPESIMQIFIPILIGLEYLHNLSIIHRDIKLTNIMRAENETILICDFGFAKKDPQINHTHGCLTNKERMGSPKNMAPELWIEHGEYGQAVDMWAAGIVLYYLIEGQYPYQGPTQILHKNPMDFRRSSNSFFKQLFAGLCHKNPAQRLTAQEALTRILNSQFSNILQKIMANLNSEEDKTR